EPFEAALETEEVTQVIVNHADGLAFNHAGDRAADEAEVENKIDQKTRPAGSLQEHAVDAHAETPDFTHRETAALQDRFEQKIHLQAGGAAVLAELDPPVAETAHRVKKAPAKGLGVV